MEDIALVKAGEFLNNIKYLLSIKTKQFWNPSKC